MRVLSRRSRWAAGIYLAVCAAVAAFALFPAAPSERLFLILVLVTFPVGAVAWVGGAFLVFIFPPDDTSFAPRVTMFAIWMLFTVAQATLVLTVRHLVRRGPESMETTGR